MHDKAFYVPVLVQLSAVAARDVAEPGMGAAFTSDAMGRRDGLNMPGPTTWRARFRQVLTLLCQGKEPPLDLCEMWVRGEQLNGTDPLQAWAASNAGACWMTGIGVIESAELCADTPDESVGHQYRDEGPRPGDQAETMPLLVKQFVIADDDEGTHVPDLPRSLESAEHMLETLREDNPGTNYVLYAQVEA